MSPNGSAFDRYPFLSCKINVNFPPNRLEQFSSSNYDLVQSRVLGFADKVSLLHHPHILCVINHPGGGLGQTWRVVDGGLTACFPPALLQFALCCVPAPFWGNPGPPLPK